MKNRLTIDIILEKRRIGKNRLIKTPVEDKPTVAMWLVEREFEIKEKILENRRKKDIQGDIPNNTTHSPNTFKARLKGQTSEPLKES